MSLLSYARTIELMPMLLEKTGKVKTRMKQHDDPRLFSDSQQCYLDDVSCSVFLVDFAEPSAAIAGFFLKRCSKSIFLERP